MKQYPWWVPETGEEEIARVVSVLKSQYLNEGTEVDQFETEVGKTMDAPFAVATTSGTAALFLALKAHGIGQGDEVLVPDITFIATANAVTLTGARPVLVDIDPQTLALTPKICEAALTSKTRAIVPVHVSGRGTQMTELMNFANRKRLIVVEDAAEALTSKQGDTFLGLFGHAGCFSFSPNKTITTGQGGMVVTKSKEIAVRIRELKDQGRPVRGTGGDDSHPSMGFNFKMTNLQAAVGISQLGKLKKRTERLRRHFELYAKYLEGTPGLRLLGFPKGEIPQWVDVECDDRDGLDIFLKAQGMHCRRFWHPIHTQNPYKQGDAHFKESTRLSQRLLWLPSAFTLTDTDIETICDQIHTFASKQFRKAA